MGQEVRYGLIEKIEMPAFAGMTVGLRGHDGGDFGRHDGGLDSRLCGNDPGGFAGMTPGAPQAWRRGPGAARDRGRTRSRLENNYLKE